MDMMAFFVNSGESFPNIGSDLFNDSMRVPSADGEEAISVRPELFDYPVAFGPCEKPQDADDIKAGGPSVSSSPQIVDTNMPNAVFKSKLDDRRLAKTESGPDDGRDGVCQGASIHPGNIHNWIAKGRSPVDFIGDFPGDAKSIRQFTNDWEGVYLR